MANRDTSIGGPSGRFPSTIWTIIEEAQSLSEGEARDRINRIITAYWKPVYLCVRAGWGKSSEDAKDLTQSFFTWLLDGDVLQKVDRGRGRFRGFLKAAVRNWLANQHRSDNQIKRGGNETIVGLDFADPELEAAVPAATGQTPEEIFDREWARTLLEEAIAEFEGDGDSVTVQAFRLFQEADDTEGPIYEAIAAKLKITRDAVKHHLAGARSRIHEILLARIKEYALDDAEVQQELELLRATWS